VLDFFRALYGTGEGWVPVFSYDPAERKAGKQWQKMAYKPHRWFQWPQQTDQLVEYCKSLENEDVSVTVGLCRTQHAKKSEIMPLNVLHCDADGAGPELFAAKPSIIVESSPKKYQLYWMLKKPVSVDKAEKLAKRIAYSQRAHGADMAWNINKAMRVPGTTNTKPDYAYPRVTAKFTGKQYSFKELDKAFAGVMVHTSLGVRDLPLPTDLPVLHEVLAFMPSSGDFWDLYQTPADPTSSDPVRRSRYTMLWALACRLFRQGLTREQVYVVCASSSNNKYAQDGRSELELWRDVLKAEAEVEENDIGAVFVESDGAGDPERVIYDVPAGVRLISDKERKQLIDESFITRYMEWASKQTIADPQYHQANAMTILSTVYSEYGYAVPKYDQMSLHLYFMVLGVSSLSKKTTAAKLMLRFLRFLGNGREHEYKMTSDVTPESLPAALAVRGDISTLYHADEAHELLADAKGGKGYMAGFMKLLTLLYDGTVQGRERITGPSTKETKTNFTVNLLGVPGRMTQVLERSDFESGFLARFIFVIGKAPIRTPEARRLEQAPKEQKHEVDQELAKLIGDMTASIRWWDEKRRKNGGNRLWIRADEESWDRWNQLVLDLDKIVDASGQAESVIITTERLAVSVHRLACLLALSENQTVVQMRHMLTAIAYAEGWFDTMNLLSSMVHENEWSRQVGELIDFVTPRKKVRMDEAYRAFRRMKFREFQEMVESARNTGQLAVIIEKSQHGPVQYLGVTS
jgi:hypothetical protein